MKRTERNGKNARLMTLEEVCAYTAMGRTRARQWCDKHGATRKLGVRMVRYDRTAIDHALDEMSQAADGEETA